MVLVACDLEAVVAVFWCLRMRLRRCGVNWNGIYYRVSHHAGWRHMYEFTMLRVHVSLKSRHTRTA
jgi:hypothetical protein